MLDHAKAADPTRRRQVLQERGHDEGVRVDGDVPQDPQIEPLGDHDIAGQLCVEGSVPSVLVDTGTETT